MGQWGNSPPHLAKFLMPPGTFLFYPFSPRSAKKPRAKLTFHRFFRFVVAQLHFKVQFSEKRTLGRKSAGDRSPARFSVSKITVPPGIFRQIFKRNVVVPRPFPPYFSNSATPLLCGT